MAATMRRGHRRPLGEGDRARDRLAGAVRVSRPAAFGLLDVCVVRAGTRGSRGRALLRGRLVWVVRRPSRGDPTPGRPADAADGSRSQGAPGASAGHVRGRSGPGRLGPFALPETAHAGASWLRSLDPCRARPRRSMRGERFRRRAIGKAAGEARADSAAPRHGE